MVVVFPAPFGPRKPRISPFSTLNDDPVDRGIAPVPFGQVLDFDHLCSVCPAPGDRGGAP